MQTPEGAAPRQRTVSAEEASGTLHESPSSRFTFVTPLRPTRRPDDSGKSGDSIDGRSILRDKDTGFVLVRHGSAPTGSSAGGSSFECSFFFDGADGTATRTPSASPSPHRHKSAAAEACAACDACALFGLEGRHPPGRCPIDALEARAHEAERSVLDAPEDTLSPRDAPSPPDAYHIPLAAPLRLADASALHRSGDSARDSAAPAALGAREAVAEALGDSGSAAEDATRFPVLFSPTQRSCSAEENYSAESSAGDGEGSLKLEEEGAGAACEALDGLALSPISAGAAGSSAAHLSDDRSDADLSDDSSVVLLGVSRAQEDSLAQQSSAGRARGGDAPERLSGGDIGVVDLVGEPAEPRGEYRGSDDRSSADLNVGARESGGGVLRERRRGRVNSTMGERGTNSTEGGAGEGWKDKRRIQARTGASTRTDEAPEKENAAADAPGARTVSLLQHDSIEHFSSSASSASPEAAAPAGRREAFSTLSLVQALPDAAGSPPRRLEDLSLPEAMRELEARGRRVGGPRGVDRFRGGVVVCRRRDSGTLMKALHELVSKVSSADISGRGGVGGAGRGGRQSLSFYGNAATQCTQQGRGQPKGTEGGREGTPGPRPTRGGTLILVEKENLRHWAASLGLLFDPGAPGAAPNTPRSKRRGAAPPPVLCYSGSVADRRRISAEELSRSLVVVADYGALSAKEHPLPRPSAAAPRRQEAPAALGDSWQRRAPRSQAERSAAGEEQMDGAMSGLHRLRWTRVVFTDGQSLCSSKTRRHRAAAFVRAAATWIAVDGDRETSRKIERFGNLEGLARVCEATQEIRAGERNVHHGILPSLIRREVYLPVGKAI